MRKKHDDHHFYTTPTTLLRLLRPEIQVLELVKQCLSFILRQRHDNESPNFRPCKPTLSLSFPLALSFSLNPPGRLLSFVTNSQQNEMANPKSEVACVWFKAFLGFQYERECYCWSLRGLGVPGHVRASSPNGRCGLTLFLVILSTGIAGFSGLRHRACKKMKKKPYKTYGQVFDGPPDDEFRRKRSDVILYHEA